jgi:hypothetical protein
MKRLLLVLVALAGLLVVILGLVLRATRKHA